MAQSRPSRLLRTSVSDTSLLTLLLIRAVLAIPACIPQPFVRIARIITSRRAPIRQLVLKTFFLFLIAALAEAAGPAGDVIEHSLLCSGGCWTQTQSAGFCGD